MCDFDGEWRGLKLRLKLRHHIGAALADCAIKAALQPVFSAPSLLLLPEEEKALSEGG